MNKSESIAKIAPALVKSWGELESPKHNMSVKVQTKKGGSYTFDYTDLKGIFDEAKRVFKENGISIIQNSYTEDTEKGLLISVETMLLHSSGEWIKSNPLQMPASQNMQDMGGQVTYMKRYSLSAMLGIATEKDDDGNGALGNDYKLSQKKATNKQLDFVQKLLKGKVTQEHPYEALYAGIKKRMNTDVEIENWTSQQASQAIKILQGDK